MNFTEIVIEALAIVKRPDKILDIRREINAAVTFFSGNQNFSRDVMEQLVAIAPAELTQTIALSQLTRFRKIKYLKRAGTKNYLQKLGANELGTNCDMQDRFYVAGSSLKIAMTATAASLDVAYYQYPPFLTDAAPTYWMIDAGWPMVLNRVVAKVFAGIGDDASARMHENYARIDYAAFEADAEKDLGFA